MPEEDGIASLAFRRVLAEKLHFSYHLAPISASATLSYTFNCLTVAIGPY